MLRRFHGKADGAVPNGGLIRDVVGRLYGTTSIGGELNCNPPYGCGVVFKLSPTGRETVLHSFTGADGINPEAGLIRDAAGNLYGTTLTSVGDVTCFSNPPSGCGVVFKLSPDGRETVLHTFTGLADGGILWSGLIRDTAGNLYGTTSEGGDFNCFLHFGCGTVFKLSTATRKLTVLHTFTGGAEDGAVPIAGLLRDAAGNLYSTADSDGAYGCGVVFKLDPKGKETVLYAFKGGTDGCYPQTGLIRDAAGNLYGTTSEGGNSNCAPHSGCGVVFKLDTNRKETVLYTFTGGTDGGEPYADLILDAAGNLYGITLLGGDVNCDRSGYGCGVVFKLDTNDMETVLYTFPGGADGSRPTGLLRDAAGKFYGTTGMGGDLNCLSPSGCGVVFKLTP